MSYRIGVILSGCGFLDGSEIHETVLTLLALDRADADVIMMAPNKSQMHVINHINGEVMVGTRRNILLESARIARGKIKDIKDINPNDIDALVIPGGFGAAKNLCDFAVNGSECEVHLEVNMLIQKIHQFEKPILAMCIAPTVVVRVLGLGKNSASVTIGNDQDTANAIITMGGKHVDKKANEIHIDAANKLITTPAYMIGQRISEVADGINRAVSALMKMLA